MAKKRKKKNKNRSLPSSPAKLEQQAHSAVKSGNYRQAQSLYQVLAKKNAEKYLPQLISVQEKLLTQLRYHKKWKDIKQLVSGLQKNDPENPTLLATRIYLALSQGDVDRAAQMAVQSINLEQKANSTLNDSIADALATAFGPSQNVNDLPQNISEELNRIHAALKKISCNALDEALAQVKPIGLRSIFSNWKLYIKGVCAYYNHEDQKALTAFGKLPGGTVAENASWPFRILMAGTKALPDTIPASQLSHGLCLLGKEAETAETLARAEYLWQVKRYRDSFKHLHSNLADFPTQNPGLNHCLTSFYYGAYAQIPGEKAESYLKYLITAAMKKKGSHAFEKFKATQAMALWLEKEADWDEEIVEIWEEAISHHNAIGEKADLAAAMVYVHMGNIFCQEEPDDDPFGFFGFRRREKKRVTLHNAELAQTCFQKAMAADPNSRKAYLALLNLYEKIGDKRKINHTLDRIIKIFPDEKDALYKAGLRCMERNALIKGMKYLEKALLLDPIDRRLRTSFVQICIKAARSYVLKDNFEKCIESLQKAESKTSRTIDDLSIGLPYLYARWAIMLRQFKGKSKDSEQMLEKALAACRDTLKLHYFTWLTARFYEVAPKAFDNSRKAVNQAMAAEKDPATGAMLVNLLRACVAGLDKKPPRWLANEIKSINEYLIEAAKPECRHEDAQTIVAYAMEEKTRDMRIARTYIRLILDQTPDNARFRWFQFLSAFTMDIHPSQLMQKKNELKAIMTLAEDQGDQEIMQAAKQTYSHIEGTVKAFEEFQTIFGKWDDDDFFDEDDDFFDENEDDEDDFFSLDSAGTGLEMEGLDPIKPQKQLDLFDLLNPKLPKK